MALSSRILGKKNFSGFIVSVETKKQVIAERLPAYLPNDTETIRVSIYIIPYSIFWVPQKTLYFR
jgi:hypothetical protein